MSCTRCFGADTPRFGVDIPRCEAGSLVGCKPVDDRSGMAAVVDNKCHPSPGMLELCLAVASMRRSVRRMERRNSNVRLLYDLSCWSAVGTLPQIATDRYLCPRLRSLAGLWSCVGPSCRPFCPCPLVSSRAASPNGDQELCRLYATSLLKRVQHRRPWLLPMGLRVKAHGLVLGLGGESAKVIGLRYPRRQSPVMSRVVYENCDRPFPSSRLLPLA